MSAFRTGDSESADREPIIIYVLLFVHEDGQEASAPHSVTIYCHASCYYASFQFTAFALPADALNAPVG